MDVASKIDHTMLKADASSATIRRYCQEARAHGFASVCVNSKHVALVASELAGSAIKTCSVIGFPLGAMSTSAKVFEARQAVADGADELDMVMDIGAAKEADWQRVREDIEAVVVAAAPHLVKVILETCLLTPEEIVLACKAAQEAGAAFVKTSTGFSTGGARPEDVRLMRTSVGDRMGVKASGGIRSHAQAVELLEAGADRLGAGDGLKLL